MNQRHWRLKRGLALVLTLVTCGPGAMVAEGTAAAAPSEAQVVFDKGLADMLAGHFETACADIEKSYHLEPLPGVMFTLAECFAGAGKTASALARYTDFRTLLASLPSDRRLVFDERERLAVSRSEELSRLVPQLVIQVSGAAPGQVVTINGEVLEPADFGAPRRVDPGQYAVRAEASEREPWEHVISVENGQQRKLVVPPLSRLQPALPAPAAPPPPQRANRPTWAYVSGAVGLTGLAVGGAAAVMAFSRKSEVDRHCPQNACDSTGLDALSSGRAAATISNVGFGIGVAGLVGAAVGLFLIPPSREPSLRSTALLPRLEVGSTGARVSLAGAFR